MTDTLKSVVEDELQKAFELGVKVGMKQVQKTCERCGKKLGTEVTDIHTCTPMRREWVGLTDEEVHTIIRDTPLSIFRAIEAKLKEKNSD